MRTLHIGNIANNAYLAARKERSLGIEAHVISVDYTHIMGFPDWEEAEFTRGVDLHFNGQVSIEGYDRPSWFHSGSWFDIYLQFFPISDFGNSLTSRKTRVNHYQNLVWQKTRKFGKKVVPLRARAFVVGNLLQYARHNTVPKELINKIIEQFDFVTLYGPSASLARYILDKNIITLEHGTLRDFVDTKSFLAKETKAGFESAKATLVTNQDCLPKAKLLGLQNIICTPHPINDSDFNPLRKLRQNICKQESITKHFLVPARHTIPLDIDIGKGSEIIYDAIETIARYRKDIVFELVEWGDNVDGAKKRLAALEAAGIVNWSELKSRPLLKQSMVRSVGVIDQLKIPAYGAITADALGLGVPVITRHSCENDVGFFGECAQVFDAYDRETLVESITKVADLSIKEKLEHMNQTTNWFEKHLSSDVAHNSRLLAYKILDGMTDK